MESQNNNGVKPLHNMQLNYFPFLGISSFEEVSIGQIRVWNFTKKGKKYIKDKKKLDEIKARLSIHKKDNFPLDNVGIITFNDYEFREFTKEEYRLVNEAKVLLFLAFVSGNNVEFGVNSGHYKVTAENFDLYTQTFSIGSGVTSIQTGIVVPINVMNMTLGRDFIYAPTYLITPFRSYLDEDLLNALLNLKESNKEIFERIINSADLLLQALYNDPSVSMNARILLMSSAFEMLLNLSSDDPRKGFMKKIENLTELDNELKIGYITERISKTVNISYSTLKRMWADKFYILRNHIIHGQVIEDNHYYFNKQRHIDIGLLFYILLIKKLINKICKHKIFFDEIRWKRISYYPVPRNREKSYVDTYEGFEYSKEIGAILLSRMKERSK